ncbi:hypothetical protein BH23BAC2_BH23BAC2_06880 [soil metagenome]
MDSNLKIIARIGYVAKGTVYGLAGILTLLAAFNLGAEKTDQLRVLDFLKEQTFGNILLGILGAGLFCYSAWRFIQSISDPESIGTDKKAKIKRIAFFISGCIYFGLAVLSFYRIFSNRNSSGSGDTVSQSPWLASDSGLIVLGIVGTAFIGTGIYQFVRIYKKDFVKKFQLKSMKDEKLRMTIYNTAYMGMGSRGVIFLIVGYFALHAAWTSNTSDIKTTMDAFKFLEDSPHGVWLLGIVAAGLVCYAVYMFIMTKYRKFKG